jgi:hypothetical protein
LLINPIEAGISIQLTSRILRIDIKPLEAIFDAVTGCLGHDVAAELMMIWMPVIAGEDLAA